MALACQVAFLRSCQSMPAPGAARHPGCGPREADPGRDATGTSLVVVPPPFVIVVVPAVPRREAAVAVAVEPLDDAGQRAVVLGAGVVALFGVPSHIGEPDLLSGKLQWLLNTGGTAVLMYNGRKSDEMDFYRKLGTKVRGPDGTPVSDDFWTVRQDDDPDWLTVVGRKP